MDTKQEAAIAHEFKACVDNTTTRIQAEDTFRPFHASLLSKEALFWSRFERSFSTSFGQRVIERISNIGAISGGAEQAETQRETMVSLSKSQLAAIEDHIGLLRTNGLGRKANWEQDIKDVQAAADNTTSIECLRVISDLWWKKGGVNHYMSIKTVKPNIDQTCEAKRDLLKLKLSDPECKVFFGLYYNPYGENQQDYSWGPPMKVFDFRNDPVVLIGKNYWDTLGGDGFYEEVLAIAAEVGKTTRKTIKAMNI